MNNLVRVLRAFFAWLNRKEYTEGHILKDLRPPKMVKQITVDQPGASQPNETLVTALPRKARGLRGRVAKRMWKVSFELGPII